jgi:DNA-binding GntR family transcriptional regulator
MGKPLLHSTGQRLGRLENAPLRQRIADILRDAILSGDFKPGEALTEASIAEQFQVSRAPVREAIRVLAKEGLIESVPYKGTTVRTLTPKDIEEVYSLREQLEAFAIRRIIESGDADLALLDAICQRMRAAADEGDMHTVSLEDERFHKTMIQLAQHDLLASLWNTLSLRVRQIMALRNAQNQNPQEVAGNHPPIVEALRQRDLERALELNRVHVTSAADLVLEGWPQDAPHEG